MRNALILLAFVPLFAFAGGALAGDNDVSVGGTAWVDYFVDTTDWPDGYNDDAERGFHFRRSYLTVKKSWDDMMFRVTTDIDSKYGTKNLNVFVKYAYFQWKGLIPNAAILVGQHSPKTHGWVEKRWHYRSVAKTMGDANKWTSSAELGVGLQGKAADKKVEYYLDVNNGNGYKKSAAKDGIGVAGRLAYKPAKGVFVSAMASSNTPGGEDDDAEVYVEGFAGYEEGRFGIFGQYGMFTDGNSDDRESTGISVFGRARIQEGLYALGRVDVIDPDTDVDDNGHNIIIVGIDFEAGKGLHIQPAFRMKTYQADKRMDDTVELPDSESEIVVTAVVNY